MGLRVNTNVASINAQRHLTKQQGRAEHALAALASGERIVHASDDAAGLSISENIRSQVRGLRMARQNSFNSVSMIQIAEGGLMEINNIMVRIRELGVQAASDNISDVERSFLNQESTQLLQEAQRISVTTRFGNQQLLDGTGGEFEFHVGAFGTENDKIKYELTADATGGALGYDGIDLSQKEGARDALQSVDDAIIKIGAMRADFGAVQSRLETTTRNLDVQIENMEAAKSRIKDADVAFESSELASAQILQNAAVGTLVQANNTQAAALKLFP
ncbi:MAG: flagellin FliC [Bdellovibrionales bacterium]|nr:flagellin FliC [Bdellovibrionales bacterium]